MGFKCQSTLSVKDESSDEHLHDHKREVPPDAVFRKACCFSRSAARSNECNECHQAKDQVAEEQHYRRLNHDAPDDVGHYNNDRQTKVCVVRAVTEGDSETNQVHWSVRLGFHFLWLLRAILTIKTTDRLTFSLFHKVQKLNAKYHFSMVCQFTARCPRLPLDIFDFLAKKR